MRLSTMVQNQTPKTEEVQEATPTTEEVDTTVTPNEAETNEDAGRGTAADVTEEELEFIKAIANPTTDDETKVEDHTDPDVQTELDAMKSMAGI